MSYVVLIFTYILPSPAFICNVALADYFLELHSLFTDLNQVRSIFEEL